MTRAGAVVAFALALAAGIALRAARLDVRPMHHDEANQAVKFGALLERGEYRYDPTDHHGPTLYYLTLPSAWLRGQHTLASLDERTLRAVPVCFGAATILLVALLSGAVGRTAAAAAAALMALSPAMVFYSRMFIQESLFACFTLAFVIAVGHAVTRGRLVWSACAGVAAGLALATKETAAIVLPATLVACAIAWWSLAPTPPRPPLTSRGRWALGIVGIAAAAIVAALFYSSFFAAPGAILGPFRGAGGYVERGLDPAAHAHPWSYYLRLLAYTSDGGVRWSEGLVLLLAATGALLGWPRKNTDGPPQTNPEGGPQKNTDEHKTFSALVCSSVAFPCSSEPQTNPGGEPQNNTDKHKPLSVHLCSPAAFPRSSEPQTNPEVGPQKHTDEHKTFSALLCSSVAFPCSSVALGTFWVRYLTLYVLITAAIFSAIRYKTPWNLLPFYVVAFVLAGIGLSALLRSTASHALRAALAAVVLLASAQLAGQAWRASVTYAADPRNPYVYAQTVPDAVRMAARIRNLSALHAGGAQMQVSVIAPPHEQWPLPWYLRTMPNVGYWTAPGDPLALRAPVIVSSIEHTPALDRALGDRYVSEFFGLRPDVLLALYVERALWDRFLAKTAANTATSLR